MRLSQLLYLPLLASAALAQEAPAGERFEYQSDVSRLRNIVVNSLYGSKEVFLRELISNANDALEKLRLTSLTDKDVAIGFGELNVTILAEPDANEVGGVGRLIISDTGIGMTPEDLKKNLGTIAKSGTSDFLKEADGVSKETQGNLIGQFGLGFYSSFLIADHVRVASRPPPSKSVPEPRQHIFESSSDGTSFSVYEDPRGNTIAERGTEIVMVLKKGEEEWLEESKLRALVEKHSSFASTFPIYLQTTIKVTKPVSPLENEEAAAPKTPADGDETEEAEVEEELKEPVTEEVEEVAFERLNKAEPIWVRDPKTVTKEEYEAFYKATSKDTVAPLTWTHFKSDTASGIGFKALIFVPSALPQDFWQKADKGVKNVRMMVKRVFITDDLGEQFIPNWLAFLKIHVDADDLPLTVSRDTLGSSRFVHQLQRTLIKKSLDLFTKLSKDDIPTFKKLYELVGPSFKMGVAQTYTDRLKLAKLLRFTTNLNEFVSFDDYVSRRRTGQTQIFFLAGLGQTPEEMVRSPFVEKLHARGYEVLLLDQPMDEYVLQQLRTYDGLTFQDVTKKGLKFGDEDLDAEDEKTQQETLKQEFTPLIDWIKEKFAGIIKDVVISQRLVSSPTAIVSDDAGMSANMIRLMAAQSNGPPGSDPMLEFLKNQPRALEINPHSPLIKGLLEEVTAGDPDAPELKDTMRTLLDLTLVRSGFNVEDLNSFFGRVESLLRRSLNVSPTAKTILPEVKPAPEIEVGPVQGKTAAERAHDEMDIEALLAMQDEQEEQAAAAQEDDDDVPVQFEPFDRQKLESLKAARQAREQEPPVAAHDEL